MSIFTFSVSILAIVVGVYGVYRFDTIFSSSSVDRMLAIASYTLVIAGVLNLLGNLIW